MTNLTEVRVAFDNAGGVTIVAPTYAHGYDDGKQAAEDVKVLLAGEETSTFGTETMMSFCPPSPKRKLTATSACTPWLTSPIS